MKWYRGFEVYGDGAVHEGEAEVAEVLTGVGESGCVRGGAVAFWADFVRYFDCLGDDVEEELGREGEKRHGGKWGGTVALRDRCWDGNLRVERSGVDQYARRQAFE